VQSLGHAFSALCRAHVGWNDVLLSLCPFRPVPAKAAVLSVVVVQYAETGSSYNREPMFLLTASRVLYDQWFVSQRSAFLGWMRQSVEFCKMVFLSVSQFARIFRFDVRTLNALKPLPAWSMSAIAIFHRLTGTTILGV
jgi:hypothetical protein